MQAKQEEVEIMCLEVLYSTDMLFFYNIFQRYEVLNIQLGTIFELVCNKRKNNPSSTDTASVDQIQLTRV